MSFASSKINRFTLALGAAIALSAMPAAHAEDGEYGVLMKTLSNPFWGAMGQGVEDGAKAAGVKYFAAGGGERPGGRAAAQRLQHHAGAQAGGDDHRGDQFDQSACRA